MYIVSGADKSHAESLYQFVSSAITKEIGTRLVIYDLGMTDNQRDKIEEKLGRNGEIKKFPFEEYPSFFNISVNAGEYAWKPAIVIRELDRSSEAICWMDAGNVIRKRLVHIRFSLKVRGFFSPPSAGTVADWTHPSMLHALGLPSHWRAGHRNLSGACVAFDPKVELASSTARQWAHYASIRDCIAPKGSSRANHRQDQALLTVLAYRNGLMRAPNRRWPLWDPEFLQHQDVESQMDPA